MRSKRTPYTYGRIGVLDSADNADTLGLSLRYGYARTPGDIVPRDPSGLSHDPDYEIKSKDPKTTSGLAESEPRSTFGQPFGG
jgi:hypothetical protein